eukprot:Hpha_TRINITY_DN16052_c3_g2::TRINITY_DN16052_c3_g2_i3::g.119404::m.119404/K04461/PPM1B, PP2CB; protein phosphatase 1B
MGPILPKPVTTKVLERRHTPMCRVGLASTNGFREGQEDAHAILIKEKWAFFGVFDGHCGALCSHHIARRFMETVKSLGTLPMPEQALTEMCLRLDREFLDTDQEGGSTGTFAFVVETGKGKYKVQVGNVGDSRTLLGVARRRALPLGSCQSLTEDHKPSLVGERRRIERAGGHVSNTRVDGALAVSRAFGDRPYKVGGKTERDHKVIAVPDIKTTEAEKGDVLLLCCDGVFESDVFSNKSLVSFMWDRYDQSPSKDLARIAGEVTEAAINRGSKDNISCLLVQLGEGPPPAGPEHELLPGPFAGPGAALTNGKFRAAYKAATEQAKVPLPQCLDLRWEMARSLLRRRKEQVACEGKTCDFSKLEGDEMRTMLQRLNQPIAQSTSKQDMQAKLRRLAKGGTSIHGTVPDTRPIDIQELEQELVAMPLPEQLQRLPVGHPDRIKHFDSWLQEQLDRFTSNAARASDEGIPAKVLALQRAGLPLPIIMNLLQQQAGGAQPPGVPLPGSVG